jgi:hypothetical protein
MPTSSKRTTRPPRIKGRKTKAGERSLKHLRKLGYEAAVAEKFVAKVFGSGQRAEFEGGFRKDLFGFMDILAYHDGGEHPLTLAVQTTSRQQITAHLRAYRRDAELAARIQRWLKVPGRAMVIHGWECVAVPKKHGDGTKAEWQLTERWVTAEDLVDSIPQAAAILDAARQTTTNAKGETR